MSDTQTIPDVGEPELDFAAANEWKAGVVKQMTGGVAGLLKANGVDWVKGAGKFKDANTISVEGGEDVTFKSAIVATIQRPSVRSGVIGRSLGVAGGRGVGGSGAVRYVDTPHG